MAENEYERHLTTNSCFDPIDAEHDCGQRAVRLPRIIRTVPFDSTKQTTLTGIVKEFDWTNPHTWIWINVPNDKGGMDLWGVEGMSPNYLGRRGWTKSTIKPGEKITIVGRPMKDGSKAAMFMSATLANGKVMTQSGQPTD